MKQYKVDYEMIVGKGMFHCYPLFPICREGKEGWEMMVRLIKNGDSRKYRTSLPIVSGRSTCVRGRFFPGFCNCAEEYISPRTKALHRAYFVSMNQVLVFRLTLYFIVHLLTERELRCIFICVS